MDDQTGYYGQQFVEAVHVPSPRLQGREWVKSIIISQAEERNIDPSLPLAIAFCESGFRADAVNDNPTTGDYSVGVFQINLFGNLAKERPSEEWLKDARNNITWAFDKAQRDGGWQAWSCARR